MCAPPTSLTILEWIGVFIFSNVYISIWIEHSQLCCDVEGRCSCSSQGSCDWTWFNSVMMRKESVSSFACLGWHWSIFDGCKINASRSIYSVIITGWVQGECSHCTKLHRRVIIEFNHAWPIDYSSKYNTTGYLSPELHAIHLDISTAQNKIPYKTITVPLQHDDPKHLLFIFFLKKWKQSEICHKTKLWTITLLSTLNSHCFSPEAIFTT